MIVDSMTYVEVYRELERDRENVGQWWLHQRTLISKMAKRFITFPKWLRYEYQSPRRNEYLITCIVYGRNYNNNAATIFLALRRVANGTEVYTTWLPWQLIAKPSVFLPHMFRRYAERAGVDKTGVDLIRHFFERNSMGQATDNVHCIGRSVRYNGEQHMAQCVRDGVLLGQMVDGEIYVARTFITYDMASGLQQEEFDAKREQIEPMNATIHEMMKIYRNLDRW